MAVTISIAIKQNSQSVVNNTSNVTVSVTAAWTNGSYNSVVNAAGTPQAKGSVTIDGKSYSFASTFNTGRTTSGSQTIFTKTVNVAHGSNGEKTLACSASYNTYVSSGTVTASVSKALTTIPRKSTLTTSNGTLGTAQTLTVTKQSSNFTHTITYKCGNTSGTICTKSSSTSVSWTPPLTLAQQNKTGTSVSVVFTITTYNGNTSLGSNTKTISCSIPASVKPTVSFTITDAEQHEGYLGAYIQGHSKAKVTITASGNQGSTITSYRTTVDGKTYAGASFTSSILLGSGDLTISVTVTDSRGRTTTAIKTITVAAYSAPKITALSVYRSDAEGVASSSGAYLTVKFSATSNTTLQMHYAYYVSYKKVSETTYTQQYLSAYSENATVTDGVYTFPAETGSSYNIVVGAEDEVETTTKTVIGSSVKKFWSWFKRGTGIAFGKIAEHENVFEVAFQTLLTGGLRYPVLEPNTDLNDVTTPGFYVGENVSTYEYVNCPLTSGTFTFEVLSMGSNGQLMQRLTQCHISSPTVYERTYYKSAGWGDWFGGWIYPTLGSEFAVYSDTGENAPACRKDGRLVEVRGIVTPVSDIAGGTDMHTIITLPVGYRPSSPVYTICQGSGNCTWLLRVNANGAVDFSRYRNGNTTTTAAADTWLPFQVTYFAN